MKKLNLLFFTILISLLRPAIAQKNNIIDSLQKVIHSYAKEDSQKVNLQIELTKQFLLLGDFEIALQSAKQAETLSKKIIPVANEVKKEQSVIYNFYGVIYFDLGNYPEALRNYFIALNLREELKDKKGIAATYHNIGNVYYAQKNKEAAMKNYNASLKIKREMGDTLDSHYAHTINNVGNFYEQQKNYSEARKYYTESYRLCKQLDDKPGMVSAYCNLGNLFIYEGDCKTSLSYYETALQISEEIGDKQNMAAIYNSIGNLYFKLRNIKMAEEYLNKGLQLSKQIGSKGDEMTSYECLNDMYDTLLNYKESLKYYKLYIACKDSLNNEESAKKSVRLEMNYEFEKKEAAAQLELEKKEAVAKAESRKQQIIIWSVCGILVLVLCFAIFAYRSYLQKRKANEAILRQKEIIEEKQKEILDSIYYAKRIQMALLPSEKYIVKNIKKLP